ncbi:MAG: type III-B CRISPR-associated protein Cas10/Cmr2 [Defluviitaleaceae bacterium]|nr:type III-B CRISPR-associated protein Cas10/Cmr2 [Defluviitaleaceae bacterium]
MGKALFAFTIGPVKSFVENGRKMNDLYAGSRLLSKLTKCAVEFLEEKSENKNIEVIFPLPSKEFDSLPNRLLANIENYCEEQHKKLAEDLSCHVKKNFEEIYKKEFTKFKNFNISESDLKKAENQLKNFLEFYWLFQPYNCDEEYNEAYQDIFHNLHSVKSIRQFKQLNEPWGRKCSLHPEYNAIFVKKNEKCNYPHNTNPNEIIDISNVESLNYKVKQNEALSAVAMLKRLYGDNEVRSIREIVLKKTLDFNNNLLGAKWYKENITCEVRNIQTQLVNAIYDVYNKLPKNNDEYSLEIFEIAEKLVENLKNKSFKLQQYYALLKFDGDYMGTKYLELKSKSEHKKLSKKICNFAICAEEMIKKVGGICIYAGGEDILAILPLEELWETLQELHFKFGEMLKMPCVEPFTFSSGIVIAHLMQPLKDVMYQANKAEKLAKEANNKNSFSVSLMKRGSEIRHITYSFEAEYEKLESLKCLINLFKEDTNSKTFIYDISQTLNKLSFDIEEEIATTLIEQSLQSKGICKSDEVLKHLNVLYENKNHENFLNMLNIVGFLSKEVMQN